ncbi:nitrite/sulfite reductase [Parvularcula dongshanensis]|uniref:Sulfite reductase (NADPH) hemoprotein beta-component n=1 Tax=Parvularcula dongshanensis TaxID=1173995 RepID=A0A840I1G6_9PROT|nr:nitrite/sulfite reductase [Parvularcula dongshanensis]MBB4658123.1 sulfite reductase (NADPH) hemoprotein beta-component [Parvularcula dongshanensis]
MYQYDDIDKAIVQARVDEFRGQVARRLTGELTEDQFKPLRLQNGLYLQLHAYMLRVAIPYGTLSADQLRVLASIARDYDKGYGHVSTRQNMQFNWPALVNVPDILQRLCDAEMHAIQTSGNCIRNVTSDPFAGAAAGEVEDPRIWCEVIRQWSTFHPEFAFLPRKFKIAVTASDEDRAAIQVHDIGIQLRTNDAGEPGFRILVGGGLGRTPYIGHVVRDFLPRDQLLSYLEAILRVYNVHGRRDNLFKARIKILVNEMGEEAFTHAVEQEWEEIRKLGPSGSVDLPEAERARIAGFFREPDFAALDDTDFRADPDDAGYARWLSRNVSAHKRPGYAIVTVSLKPEGEAPGDITADQMDALADLADRYSFSDVRTTHEQNMVLPHVRQADLPALYAALSETGLGSANAGLVSDIIACPGLDYCNLANTRSIPVANRIQKRFSDPVRQAEVGELKIKISGCINACGHHHVGHIGILGVDKKGEEFYQVTLGGRADAEAAIGEIVGRGLATDQVVDAVEKLVDTYLSLRTGPEERFIDAYKRLGAEPFKEALYETA